MLGHPVADLPNICYLLLLLPLSFQNLLIFIFSQVATCLQEQTGSLAKQPVFDYKLSWQICLFKTNKPFLSINAYNHALIFSISFEIYRIPHKIISICSPVKISSCGQNAIVLDVRSLAVAHYVLNHGPCIRLGWSAFVGPFSSRIHGLKPTSWTTP